LLQHFCSFAQTTVVRIMILDWSKRNYYCPDDSNIMAIEEKLVLSTYFFSRQGRFIIWVNSNNLVNNLKFNLKSNFSIFWYLTITQIFISRLQISCVFKIIDSLSTVSYGVQRIGGRTYMNEAVKVRSKVIIWISSIEMSLSFHDIVLTDL